MTTPRAPSPGELAALREQEFPWAARGECVYLDNASTGPTPLRARRARAEFDALRDEPFRISHEQQFGALDRARGRCARLIGADAAEIALMVNTSYGINLAARALGLREGDTVLTFDHEFPANVYPWMALPGVQLMRVPCAGDLPDEEALLRALDRPGVRVVAVSWVQFSTGYRVDLGRLGAECRGRGIRLVVDAIQGVGTAPLDVRAANVDLLACGGQKWLLSPWGTGFVYVRRELATELFPLDIGWLSMRGSDDFGSLTEYDLTFREDARRFEVGTLPAQGFATMAASLELLLDIGLDRVAAHLYALTTRLTAWAASRDDVRLITPADPDRRSAIVALVPRDVEYAADRLRRARVAFALREGAIRISPHIYNTPAEIDLVLDALEG